MPVPPRRPKRVLVTGATSALGRFVVQALVKMGATVRAASRRAPTAEQVLGNPAVEWAEVDFTRPATLEAALYDVERLLLIVPPNPLQTAGPLLTVAERSGVQRVVAVTAMGADLRKGDGVSHFEKLVDALPSNIGRTILRPNWFMQAFSSGVLGRMIADTGVLRAPAADAQASYIDLRDVAGAAAAALLQAKLAAPGYTLTGGAALTMHEAARSIGAACGREIRYIPVDDDEAAALWTAAGLSAAQVEPLLERYELMRRGFFAPVRPNAAELLGRPPIPFARFVNDHLLAWRLSF